MPNNPAAGRVRRKAWCQLWCQFALKFRAAPCALVQGAKLQPADSAMRCYPLRFGAQARFRLRVSCSRCRKRRRSEARRWQAGGQRSGPVWVQNRPNRVQNQGRRRRADPYGPITYTWLNYLGRRGSAVQIRAPRPTPAKHQSPRKKAPTAIASASDCACHGSRLSPQSDALAPRRICPTGSAALPPADDFGRPRGIARGCLRLPQPWRRPPAQNAPQAPGECCHTRTALPANPHSPLGSRRPAVSRFPKQTSPDLLPRDDIGRVLLMPSDAVVKLHPLRIRE